MNRFLVEREPWAKPGAPESLATLSEAARALRLVALALEPAMPAAAPQVTAALGFEGTDFVNARWEDRQHRPRAQADRSLSEGGQGGVLCAPR